MLIHMTPEPAALCNQAKWAFATRRVVRADVFGLSKKFAEAESGDLVLGRVSFIGQHKGLQLTTGRRSILYPGDFVVAACGARYAPDQFEGTAEILPQGRRSVGRGRVRGAHDLQEFKSERTDRN